MKHLIATALLLAIVTTLFPPAALAAGQAGMTDLVGIIRDIYIPFNQAGQKTTSMTYYTDPARSRGGGTACVAFASSAWELTVNGVAMTRPGVCAASIGGDPPVAKSRPITVTVPKGYPQQQLTVEVLDAHNDVPVYPVDYRRIGSFYVFIGSEAVTNYAWVHTATSANTSGHITTIKAANGYPAWYLQYEPNARVLVTPRLSGPRPVFNNHPIGVYYANDEWKIFNQDFAPMPLGAQFNIRPEGRDIRGDNPVHQSTAANTAWNYTVMTQPYVVGSPGGLVFATPNWNPPGLAGGVYVPNNLGVWFTGHDWSLFNQNKRAMPLNAAFNLRSFGYAGAGARIHTATADNTNGAVTTINSGDTNGNPDAMLFVTPNWNPGGVGGTYFDSAVGVQWTGSRWTIRSLSGANIPTGASFNVYIPLPPL